MRFAAISDAHLSETLYAHRPLLRGDAGRALKAVVSRILETGRISTCLWIGDNLNSRRPSPEDVHEGMEAVLRLAKEGIPSLSIQGNHDRCPRSWLTLCGAEDISGKTVSVAGTRFSGMDFCNGTAYAEFMEWMSKIPETDVLALHQPLGVFGNFSPNTFEVEDVPDNVRWGVVCGHTHIAEIRRSISGKYVVSPGATHPRNVSEPPGTFLVVEDKVPRIEQVPGCRQIIRRQVDEDRKLDEALSICAMMSELDVSPEEMPILDLRYSHEYAKHVPEFRKAGKGCHLFMSVIGSPRLEATTVAGSSLSSREVLEKFVPKGSPQHSMLCSLIEGDDPEKMLDDLEKNCGEREKEIDAPHQA